MRILPLALVAATALAVGPALAGKAKDHIDHVKMACADNQVLDVTFINTASGNSYAVVLEQDELLPMAQTMSASGAVYTAIDKNYHYQLLTKGKTADLVAVTNGKDDFVKRDCKG